MTAITISGYIPGAIGCIAELHARYYSRNWGFGLYFEAKVASELSSFLGRFDNDRDGFWTARSENRVLGSIAIDGLRAESAGAHLRWFIVADELTGQGWGNHLMKTAIDFCDRAEYHRIYLWTFEGLDAARHLYEKNGFRLVEHFMGDQWGRTVVEQRFVRNR